MPRKPKDCGCGGGKQCVSKGRRGKAQPVIEPEEPPKVAEMRQEQEAVSNDLNSQLQALISQGKKEEAKAIAMKAKEAWDKASHKVIESMKGSGAVRDAAYLLELYMKKHKGKPKKTGGALKKDMMKFAEKTLKEMDCGCGCEGTKKLRGLSGGALKQCPPGYSEDVPGGLFCIRDCPGNMRGDAFACRGCPPGYDDMGLHCHRWWTPDSSQQDVIWRDRIERIDWDATLNDLKKGFEDAFSADGPLARAFDPEKNGVAESFRKFGENTEAAFKDLGEKMERAFDPEQNGVGAAFRKFGEDMANTLGNDQWWRDTMSNPDTYIFLIGTIASVAAIVLSGGTAGPGVIAALGALGPSLNMISAAAQGKPIDPMDIAGLALSVIPVVGQAAGGFDDAIKGAMKAGQAAGKASQATQLGKVLATATGAASKIGSTVIRTGLLAKLDKVVNLLDDVVKVGAKVKGVVKNPKSLLNLLKSAPVEKALKVPWSQLSRADKIKKLTDIGMKVYKGGKFAIKAAEFGEKQGLYTIPDVKTGSGSPELDAALAADEVPLDQIDWDNPPEGYDYVLDIEDAEEAPPGELATVNFDRKRDAFIKKYLVTPEDFILKVGRHDRGIYSYLSGKPEGEIWQEAKDVSGWAGDDVQSSYTSSEFVGNPRYSGYAYINTEPNTPQPGDDKKLDDLAVVKNAEQWYAKYRGPLPYWNSQAPTDWNQLWQFSGRRIGTLDGFKRDTKAAWKTSSNTADHAKIDGAGRFRTKSLVELNMNGRGYSEDTAYLGIDMSPLEADAAASPPEAQAEPAPLAGSGVPHHSWEAQYDRTSAENHAKKVALVRRRAEQRTVKIKPYTERPTLLTDTFKIDAGRDIHGQVQGGGAYRGAFTRGEPQAGEKEEKFYYPEFSGREARGEVAAGGEYGGPSRMASVPSYAPTPSMAVF